MVEEGDSIWLCIFGVGHFPLKYASAYLAPKCPRADKMYEKIAEGGGY